jgi:hypothetical protein
MPYLGLGLNLDDHRFNEQWANPDRPSLTLASLSFGVPAFQERTARHCHVVPSRFPWSDESSKFDWVKRSVWLPGWARVLNWGNGDLLRLLVDLLSDGLAGVHLGCKIPISVVMGNGDSSSQGTW